MPIKTSMATNGIFVNLFLTKNNAEMHAIVISRVRMLNFLNVNTMRFHGFVRILEYPA